MPRTSTVTTLTALAFMVAGIGLLMLATLMWCLTLGVSLAILMIGKPLRHQARPLRAAARPLP